MAVKCNPELKAMSVRALADTGALMLCLPEHIAIQPRLILSAHPPTACISVIPAEMRLCEAC